MYVRKVRIENIRTIEALEWEIPAGQEAGWHVVLGDNGAGKSSFLRSVALALAGPLEAFALRQDWNDWLRRGAESGSVVLTAVPDPEYDSFDLNLNAPGPIGIEFVRVGERAELRSIFDPQDSWVWNPANRGWFCAAYGPYRRFSRASGGESLMESLSGSAPRLASMLSVFGEDVALTECLRWLRELHHKKLEGSPEGTLLDEVQAFVNQEGFLPHRARLVSVSSERVEFEDGNGCTVPVLELSDGYRSILSMTFELIRQLSRLYGPKLVFDPDDPTRVAAPGVVLIDEVDAHLHPTWQRRIGQWFRTHFPRMQFIVTTHSPLICQAAEVGSVWRLPRPGIEEEGGMVTGTELNRLLYGDVLDAYSTGVFGPGVTRSDVGKQRLERLAELNVKELFGEGLTPEERDEQRILREETPTAAAAGMGQQT